MVLAIKYLADIQNAGSHPKLRDKITPYQARHADTLLIFLLTFFLNFGKPFYTVILTHHF